MAESRIVRLARTDRNLIYTEAISSRATICGKGEPKIQVLVEEVSPRGHLEARIRTATAPAVWENGVS